MKYNFFKKVTILFSFYFPKKKNITLDSIHKTVPPE